ncbi:Thioesterase superfamily [Botryosphaeria dothidea]|uniref:Thioesterase superfamily n=1 Tax=Botryosphaeria dothidea TaxID=55169 RepID=A0A8H4J022_9PEZI|nr:Thioesterase superfamily [Botryosphaeria dothidea]
MLSDDVAYFSSIPWCAKLLSDQNTVPIDRRVRDARYYEMGDNIGLFILETLSTERTIRADLDCQLLPLRDSNYPIHTLLTLYDTGGGVSTAWKAAAHTGFITTLLDETRSLLLHANMELILKNTDETPPAWVTRSTKLDFRRPVPVDRVILVRAKLDHPERKNQVVVASTEDENGTIFCTAESLFVRNYPREHL